MKPAPAKSRAPREELKIPVVSLAERPKGPNPNVAPPGGIPIRELMHMQSLCEEGKADEEIAAALGLSLADTAQIISDEGWRAPIEEIEALKPKEQRMRLRWQKAIAAQARFLSFKGISLAHSKADKGDAMGFALAARGTKAFVDMAFQADGMGVDDGKTGPASVNLFFFSGEALPARGREPKNVSPNPVSQSDLAASGAQRAVVDVQAVG